MTIKLSISIDVPDLKSATSFYVDALGCTKLRDQGKNMAVLTVDNTDIYLIEREGGSNPLSATQSASRRSYERHWTPVHLDFGVLDVESAVSKIVSAGGVRESGEEGEWGAIAHCSDPFGNGFCVIRE